MAFHWPARTLVDVGGLSLIDTHTSANPCQLSTFLAAIRNSKLPQEAELYCYTTDPGRRSAAIPEDDNNHTLGDAAI
jgi:hypothetical protein